MSIPFGFKPTNISVFLSKDGDFFTTLQNADGNWSGTAQIELRFGTTVWSSVISGEDAVFDIDSVQVNEVIASKVRNARLFYIDGDTEIVWGEGPVIRNG